MSEPPAPRSLCIVSSDPVRSGELLAALRAMVDSHEGLEVVVDRRRGESGRAPGSPSDDRRRQPLVDAKVRTDGFAIVPDPSASRADAPLSEADPEQPELPLFEADPRTRAIAIYSEPGGRMEAELADYVREHRSRLPIVAFLAGRFMDEMQGMRFGHAGTIVEGTEDTAAQKIARLEGAGIRVVERIDEIPDAVKEGLAVRA